MNSNTQTPVRERTVASADGTTISFQTMGVGPDVIVVGGCMQTAADYLALASTIARSCTVHLVERRGRGASGLQGPGYTLRKEVEDLLAVQAETGARLAFGHSYGGLAILETQRLFQVFDRIAVYEPGVPSAPVPTGWMGPYRERLAADDPYGAFVHFIRGSTGSPPFVTKMPQWYLRLVLRMAFRGQKWQRKRLLLEPNVNEHEQIANQHGRLAGFAAVTAAVLILCGSRSARALRADYEDLGNTLPNATLEMLPGLNHFAPTEKPAAALAERAAAFLVQ